MRRVRGSLRAAFTLETAVRLGRLIGGAITTTGSAPTYTHTVKGATDTPSIWAEKWYSDVSKGDRFFGVKLTSFGITVGGRDAAPVLIDCDLLGSGHPETGYRDQSSRYDATPDTTMLAGPFLSLADATVLIDGSAPSADITSIQLSVSLAHSPLDVLDGKVVSKALVSQWYEVTGRVEGLFDDSSALRALDGTTHSVAVKITLPTDSAKYVQLEIPSCYITVADEGQVQGSGPIRQSLALRGYYDSTAQSSWKLVVANGTSGYSTW
jgi:hypothetical protein